MQAARRLDSRLRGNDGEDDDIGGCRAPHLTPTLSPPNGAEREGMRHRRRKSPSAPLGGGGVRGGGERRGPADLFLATDEDTPR